MRNVKSFVCVLLLMTMVFLTACGNGSGNDPGQATQGEGQGAQIKPIKLTATSGVAATHKWHVGWFEPVMNQITEETDGAVTFDVFTSGELVPFGGEYDALNQQQVDMILSFFPQYDAGRFPLSEVSMLPSIGATSEINTKAYLDLFYSDVILKDGKTYKQLEYDDKDIIVIPCVTTTDSYTMVTSGQELNSMDDFTASVKMRATGRLVSVLLSNLNLTPITMTSAEIYDAMSRGALTGVVMDPNWVIMGYDDLLSYGMKGFGLGFGHASIVFTKEKWDSFPAEVQEIILKACADQIENNIQVSTENADFHWDQMQENGKVELFEDLDPEVQKHYEDATVKTWMEWIEILEKDGHPGKAVAMLWRDCLLKYGADVPQEIKDLK